MAIVADESRRTVSLPIDNRIATRVQWHYTLDNEAGPDSTPAIPELKGVSHASRLLQPR